MDYARDPSDRQETRKFQKRPPIGREGVYDENSDFIGKKTNRMEKNIKYIDCYSVKFHGLPTPTASAQKL